MANDSSIVSYLSPADRGGELNDQALHEFLQQIIVGLLGWTGNVTINGVSVLQSSMVRPRWQAEPPSQPPFSTDWVAFAVVRRRRDTFAFVGHVPSSQGTDRVYRNQILEILCSLYGPNAEGNSELVSMGFQVAQNREALSKSGFGFVSCDDAIILADQIHDRYVPRVDLSFVLRRAQLYTYGVLNLLSAVVTAQTDTGLTIPANTDFHSVVLSPEFAFDLPNTTGIVAGWDKGNWK